MDKNFLILWLLISSIGCKVNPITPVYPQKIDSTISTGAKLLWKIQKVQPNGTPVSPLRGGSSCYMQPIRIGAKVYFVYDSIAQCLDPQTGKVLWTSSFPGHMSKYFDADNMFLDNGKLIFANEGKIIALNSETGQLLWSLNSPDDIIGGFKVPNYNNNAQSSDAIYITSWYGGKLFKINKASGTIMWGNTGALLSDSFYKSYDTTANWNGCPIYSNGRVFVPGRYGRSLLSGVLHDGSVACFDAQTGTLLWCKLIPAMDLVYSPYVTNSALTNDFWSNIGQGNIQIFNDMLMIKTGNSVTWMDRDGNILWRSEKPDKHGLVDGTYVTRFWQNKLLVYDDIGTSWACYAMDPTTHNFLWTTPLSENNSDYHSYGISPPPAYVGNMVYFVSDDYWVIGVDVSVGVVKYALNLANLMNDPTNRNQIILGNFLVDQDHHIYAMDNQYIYCFQMNQ